MKPGRGLPALAVMAGFLAYTVLLAFLLGAEEMFGLSFRWGWTLVDGGREERMAVTPKGG